ncbi:hypothetical protein Acsp03_40800 [Actinomadura sp. NBRC 104412]|nr:hypothetical protein Acsp03_40800 [Actinomadura sp. NBRC 104412]
MAVSVAFAAAAGPKAVRLAATTKPAAVSAAERKGVEILMVPSRGWGTKAHVSHVTYPHRTHPTTESK